MTFLLWLGLSVLAYWVAALLSAFQTQVLHVRRDDATLMVVMWAGSWAALTVLLAVAMAVL